MNKKYTNIIIFILSFFILSNVVNASNNYFTLDFETNKEKILTEIEENEKVNLLDNNVSYQDGYVISNINIQNNIISTLTHYSTTGTKIISKNYENKIFIALKGDKKDLYALTYELDETCASNLSLSNSNSLSTLDDTCESKQFKLLKLNEKLEIKNEIVINDYESYNLIAQEVVKLLGYNIISITNNEIAILGLDDIIVIDKNLENIKSIEQRTNNIKEYFPSFGIEFENILDLIELVSDIISKDNMNTVLKTLEERTPINIPISINQNDKYIVSSGLELNSTINKRPNNAYSLILKLANITDEINDFYIATSGTLKLTDLDNNTIWEQKTSNYAAYINTTIIKNYIVTIGININAPEDIFTYDNIYDYLKDLKINSDILIYDLSGNLLDKISDGSLYLNLNPTNNGFITSNINITSLLDLDLSMNSKAYHMNNQINTKITGNGNIKVLKASSKGEEVTIEITPNKGYKLHSIKVTDENGNEIAFASNKFIMPSGDVTIEATFNVDNPNTSDITIVTIILISIFSIIVVINSHRKMKWING